MGKAKILITCDSNENMHLEVEGNKLDLMKLLAELARKINCRTNLDKKDILFAIELGLKNDTELEKEAERARKELSEKIEKLVKKLLDI